MKNKALTIVMSILGATFTIFTINCLLLNTIFSLIYEGNILNIEVNLIILAISLLVALIIVYLTNRKNNLDNFLKFKAAYIASFIFTLTFFAEFISFMILYSQNLITYKWSIPLILITLLFAICEGLIIQFVKTSNLFVVIVPQLLLTGTLYFVVTLVFFKLGNGNTLLPIIAIYLGLFIIVTSILLIIRYIVKRASDNKKEYKKQF